MYFLRSYDTNINVNCTITVFFLKQVSKKEVVHFEPIVWFVFSCTVMGHDADLSSNISMDIRWWINHWLYPEPLQLGDKSFDVFKLFSGNKLGG